MASESSVWKWLREFNAPDRDLDQQRIENSAGSGTPDVEGQYGPTHFHMELKVLRTRTTRNREEQGILKFEVGQREWSEKRWRVGGNAYTLIQGFNDDLYLIPGAFILSLKRIGTVKTSTLQSLSWWFCAKKNPEERDGLYRSLRKSNAAHIWARERLETDQQLREASQPPPLHPALLGLES